MSTTELTAREIARAEQRRAALDVGNAIRYARADLKRELKSLGCTLALRKVAELLEDPPAYLQGMKALNLLEAIPRLGRTKSDQALKAAAASPIRTIGGLTDRQAQALARHLNKLADARR
jgi:hypothetical protein